MVEKFEKLVAEILSLLKRGKTKLDQNFTVIVNQGPGSFSGVRISIAVAKGLVISKNIKLFGYKNTDLKVFDQENNPLSFQKKSKHRANCFQNLIMSPCSFSDAETSG